MNERFQINVKITAEEMKLLDAKRVALQKTTGYIPSRSEVVRLALESFIFTKKPAKSQAK
jgi:hypothetical protein